MQRRTINLTFHGIGDPPGRLEAAEEAVWLSHEEFLGILDSIAERDDIHLTFDDGNASDVEYALPALLERGLRADFFVVAGRLGQPGYVDEAGVRALSSAGMTIGSHGMRHRPWRSLDDHLLREELVEARETLERVVGAPVVSAACPFGSYDRRALRSLQRLRYQTVYTSDRGTAAPDAWLQARTTLGSGAGSDLEERLASSEIPWYRGLPRRAKLVAKRWR